MNTINHQTQGNVLASACPSRKIVQYLTSRWGLLVLISLQSGTKRFSELRRSIEGVSERMLAQTLHHLEEIGVVHREDFRTVPPHVEYSLTPLGEEAVMRARSLVDWVEGNLGFWDEDEDADH